MSERSKDRLRNLLAKKPAMAAYREARLDHYERTKKSQRALNNLTQGGILIPKPEVLREGLQELREQGHAHVARVERELGSQIPRTNRGRR